MPRIMLTAAIACTLMAPVCWPDSSANATLVRVRVVEDERSVSFSLGTPATLSSNGTTRRIPAGDYEIRVVESTPPVRHYHVFGKTFLPGEDEEQDAYVAMARAANYPVRVIEQGRRLETGSGKVLDTRMRLISLGFFPTRLAADALKNALAQREHWSWIEHEVVSEGTGQAILQTSSGSTVDEIMLPARVQAAGAIEIQSVDTGFWSESRKHQAYRGNFELRVGFGGGIDVVESLNIEDYLRGVLPAEMPPEWPLEALKAQAVAARSEVLSSLAKKHMLEGFDFCGVEHCRAYLGSAEPTANAVRALSETRGEFLVHDEDVVATVFSSTCGGWTENNETVWSGRAVPALRGVPDVPGQHRTKSPNAQGIERWIHSPPDAFCATDDTYFRWTRSFTAPELTDIVNQTHSVGTVTGVVPGERGISGRLKWVQIIGSANRKNVYKELPIRRVFGGLPSALFIVETINEGGQTLFRFHGAGRGHGVGLCQNGARSMADSGYGYKEILTHYFTDTSIERYR